MKPQPIAPAETLWIKLSEDTSLPDRLDARQRARLAGIFDASDSRSPWSRALRELGLSWPGGRVIAWQGDTAYTNASAMVSMISAGWVVAVREGDHGYRYQSKKKLLQLPALIKSQWKIDEFIAQALDGSNSGSSHGPPKKPAPISTETQDDLLTLSLALGLALQSLMLRLPAHTPLDLARWLAGPRTAPARARKTIELLQRVQIRRTEASQVWQDVFDTTRDPLVTIPSGSHASLWAGDDSNLPQALRQAPQADRTRQGYDARGPWRGMPVHPGRVTGRAWWVDLREPGPPPPPPYVLIFAQARPEAVLYYADASGVVFGEGGVLSHACAVAREQRLPAITAIGRQALEALRNHKDSWLTLDGLTGEIELTHRD